MGNMKTPGVYIREESAFPNSVVAVPTAVPAFIGHTQKAENGTKSLKNTPFRITSMLEYETYFGGAPTLKYELESLEEKKEAIKKTITAEIAAKQTELDTLKAIAAPTEEDNKKISDLEAKIAALQKELSTIVIAEQPDFTIKDKGFYLTLSTSLYTLYYNMNLFFANGGGACYIVSIGTYTDSFNVAAFTAGIDLLLKEQEPTMLVIPEAVNLNVTNCQTIQQAALMHCGDKMKNRIVILDVFEGFRSQKDPKGDVIKQFRESVGNFLDYSAAYYPWVHTSVVSESNISKANFVDPEKFLLWIGGETGDLSIKISICQLILSMAITKKNAEIDADKAVPADQKDAKKKEAAEKSKTDFFAANTLYLSIQNLVTKTEEMEEIKKQISALLPENEQKSIWSFLVLNDPGRIVVRELCRKINLLPPSAALAGIYARVDNSRGVWKAPANVGVNQVVVPAVTITDDDQQALNVDLNGKSINAIRYFKGEGVKVWGARTMLGNSQDWRYVNVRRTLLFLEESIKNAARAYVFEPNVAGTWLNMKSMIENFLYGIWKQGGLVGASPEDAYSVHVGLGDTMTSEDILEGILKITILVAISHPAEFIEITFQQQMQKS